MQHRTPTGFALFFSGNAGVRLSAGAHAGEGVQPGLVRPVITSLRLSGLWQELHYGKQERLPLIVGSVGAAQTFDNVILPLWRIERAIICIVFPTGYSSNGWFPPSPVSCKPDSLGLLARDRGKGLPEARLPV
jgi:hypothetical protein